MGVEGREQECLQEDSDEEGVEVGTAELGSEQEVGRGGESERGREGEREREREGRKEAEGERVREGVGDVWIEIRYGVGGRKGMGWMPKE